MNETDLLGYNGIYCLKAERRREAGVEMISFSCLQNCSGSFNLRKIKRYNRHKYYPELPLFLIDYCEKIYTTWNKNNEKMQVAGYFSFFHCRNISTYLDADPCQEIWNFNSVSNTENSSGNGTLVKTNSIKLIIKMEN